MLENSYPIRTDLALESQERLQEDQADMRGIRVLEERRENGVIVSTVMIETENASVAMGRPKGTYITIEAPEMIEEDAGYHRDISLELAKIMRNLLPGKEIEKNLKKGLEVAALVVGLGNREVTPDALGPRVVDNLFITRHILNEFGKYAFQREDVGKVSGIVPGVMAQTGMECVEILKTDDPADGYGNHAGKRNWQSPQCHQPQKCGRSRDFSRCADGRGCGNDCLGCHDGIYFRIIAFGSAEAG